MFICVRFRCQSGAFQAHQQHDVEELFHAILGQFDVGSWTTLPRAEQSNNVDVSQPLSSLHVAEGDEVKDGHLFASTGGLAKKLFTGRLEASTRCVDCETTSACSEQFTDISLSVSDDRHGSSRSGQEEYVAKHSLGWCFDRFARPRLLLAGEDKYACGVCRRGCEASTAHCFTELPEALVIHLKRFTTSWSR